MIALQAPREIATLRLGNHRRWKRFDKIAYQSHLEPDPNTVDWYGVDNYVRDTPCSPAAGDKIHLA